MSLAATYIDLKYGNPSIDDLVNFRKECVREVNAIERRKSDVFKRFTGVHGRFQQSQLDVMDIQQNKVSAMIQNVNKMINKAKGK